MLQKRMFEALNKLRVFGTEIEKVRAGDTGDGGYIIPDDCSGLEGVVSIGIGNNVSFDKYFSDRDIPVYQYDHTVEGPPIADDNFFFHKKAWGTINGENVATLSQIVRQHNLKTNNLLLKFDVEGAEWENLGIVNPELLKKFRIITCEFHFWNLDDPILVDNIVRSIDVLTTHHSVVHIHPNNHGDVKVFAGIPLPTGMDVTFLRKDRASFIPVNAPIPSEIDFPNFSGRPDILLTPFWHFPGHTFSAVADQGLSKEARTAWEQVLDGLDRLQNKVASLPSAEEAKALAAQNDQTEAIQALRADVESLTSQLLQNTSQVQEMHASLHEALASIKTLSEALHQAISDSAELLQNRARQDETLRELQSSLAAMTDQVAYQERVQHILTNELLATHFRDHTSMPAGHRFNSEAYLAANPDVVAACQDHLLPSAFYHWLLFGINEKRSFVEDPVSAQLSK